MSYSLSNLCMGASIYTVGQVLTKASGFLLIPLYTRFLTPADYGVIGYLQLYLQILIAVFAVGLHSAQNRYYFDYLDDRKRLGTFLCSINVFLIALLLLFCALFLQFGARLYALLPTADVPFQPYMPIMMWMVLFQIMNQMVTSYYLVIKKYKTSAILQFVQFVLLTGLVIYFVVARHEGAAGRLKGEMYANILFFALFYPGYVRRFVPGFSLACVKVALAFGAPIVVHLLAGIVHQLIDRFILKYYVSIDELGIYTLGYTVGMVLNVIICAIDQAWGPSHAELMSGDSQDKAHEMRRFFGLWLVAIGGICLVGMLWSRELLVLLAPPTYAAAAGIVPTVLLAYFMQGIYFISVAPVFFFKKTKLLPYLTVATAAVNVLCNLVLIPRFGIAGAAYSTLLSFTFQAATVHLLGNRLFNPRYDYGRIAGILIFLVTVLFTCNFTEISLQAELLKAAIFAAFVCLGYRLFALYLDPIVKSGTLYLYRLQSKADT